MTIGVKVAACRVRHGNSMEVDYRVKVEVSRAWRDSERSETSVLVEDGVSAAWKGLTHAVAYDG